MSIDCSFHPRMRKVLVQVTASIAMPRTSFLISSHSFPFILCEYMSFVEGRARLHSFGREQWTVRICIWLRPSPFPIRRFAFLCRISVVNTAHLPYRILPSLASSSRGSQYPTSWLCGIKCWLTILAILQPVVLRLSMVIFHKYVPSNKWNFSSTLQNWIVVGASASLTHNGDLYFFRKYQS